ncbi:hypothetical protein MMC12_002244 [Toensbergia leucococca]|nr:hypothetical protein [Toensbergia leucococca]
MVGIFPDLPHCHCTENIFDLPTMDGLDIYVGLMDGVKLGESALAGFPSLKTLTHTGGLGFHGVNVFQQDSRNESMVVTMLDTENRTKAEQVKIQLGRKVYVGYPFLSEAKVIRVSDELFDYILPPNDAGPPMAVPHGPQEIDMWRKKAERIEAVYSKRLGIIIGQVESLVHVDMLKGLKKTDNGATIKEYAHIPGIEVDYASQMIVEEVISEDQRFLEKAALPIEEEFPEGARAFFLGEFNYGRPLEILRHVANKVEIWISIVSSKESDFGREISQSAERASPYTPSFAVAKKLGLNPLVLSKLTSAFQVNVDDSRVNLGLNLKFEAKKLKVLGYSRRGPTGWEFSEKAIQLIQQYMISFPEFIAGVQRNSQGNIYNATDFYAEGEAKAKIKEIQSWLKVVESKNFEKVPLEALQLDSDAVKKIEKAADNAVQNGPSVEGKKIKGVPRNALLKPSDAEHRLGHQHFSLGDRVVYVQDSGRVPIATRGTVVGLTRTSRTTLLDVVFDIPFMSGSSLGERCSPFRGSTVPIESVLNISDRQNVAGSRAAVDHRPPQQAQSLTVSGYGAPLGPNGQGQLIPAYAPPPLRGSFRGALGGHQNGARGGMFRGRGGLELDRTQNGHQQSFSIHNQPPTQTDGFKGRSSHSNGLNDRGRGSTDAQQLTKSGHGVIDRGVAEEGLLRTNPEFRPQSYSSVPPPASLDFRGRGRTGGGYRGGPPRGDGFRGRGYPRGRGEAATQQQ